LSDDHKHPDRHRIWTIGELSKEFGVTARALRFYEDKGLISPQREGLNRLYSYRDRSRLQMILRGKRVGLTLVEIREILDLYELDDDQRTQMKVLQDKLSRQVGLLRAQREDLEGAIQAIEQRLVWLDEQLARDPASVPVAGAHAYDAVARASLDGETVAGDPSR
jgi:DNA-binding transcriptional MerR regulator